MLQLDSKHRNFAHSAVRFPQGPSQVDPAQFYLQAAGALVHQASLRELLDRLLPLLLNHMKAHGAALFLTEADGLSAMATFQAMQEAVLFDFPPASCPIAAPKLLLEHARQTRNILVGSSAQGLQGVATFDFRVGQQDRYCCVPLERAGGVEAVLYFEGIPRDTETAKARAQLISSLGEAVLTALHHVRENEEPPLMLQPEIGEVTSMEEQFMAKLKGIVDARFGDERFGVEALADEMAMSRTQLHRRMKAVTGRSSSDFLRNYRLAHARGLLERNAAPVGEVAFLSGFSSASAFSKCFKARYGLRPKEVRGNGEKVG